MCRYIQLLLIFYVILFWHIKNIFQAVTTLLKVNFIIISALRRAVTLPRDMWRALTVACTPSLVTVLGSPRCQDPYWVMGSHRMDGVDLTPQPHISSCFPADRHQVFSGLTPSGLEGISWYFYLQGICPESFFSYSFFSPVLVSSYFPQVHNQMKSWV